MTTTRATILKCDSCGTEDILRGASESVPTYSSIEYEHPMLDQLDFLAHICAACMPKFEEAFKALLSKEFWDGCRW